VVVPFPPGGHTQQAKEGEGTNERRGEKKRRTNDTTNERKRMSKRNKTKKLQQIGEEKAKQTSRPGVPSCCSSRKISHFLELPTPFLEILP